MEKLLLCTILLKLFSLEVQADANLTITPECRKPNLLGLSGRVFNGSPTTLGEYPWLGYLRTDILLNNEIITSSIACTSSLLTSNWVLTAAQCVSDESVRKYPSNFTRHAYVTLGEWNRSSVLDCETKNNMPVCAPKPITLVVTGIFDHPQYAGNDVKYDIALLRLERNVQYTPYIQPICLLFQPIDRYEGHQAIMTGWGAYEKKKNYNEIKRKSIATIRAYADCPDWYQEQLNETHHLCVGGPDGGACLNDMGGPLLLQSSNDTNTYYQIGVASLTLQECANISKPSVYVRIDKFIDWIRATIQGNDQ